MQPCLILLLLLTGALSTNRADAALHTTERAADICQEEVGARRYVSPRIDRIAKPCIDTASQIGSTRHTVFTLVGIALFCLMIQMYRYRWRASV